MPQTQVKAELWSFLRDSIDFIPIVVKVNGTPTTSYTIQVQPWGTDSDLAGTWTAPDSATPDTGYKVNGPALSGGVESRFHLYIKISDSPLTPVFNPINIAFR